MRVLDLQRPGGPPRSVALTDAEVDVLQDVIEDWCGRLSVADLDRRPWLLAKLRLVESIGLKIGMEKE